MTRPRIALLNAAHDGNHTRRNFRRELAADLVEFHCPSGDIPDTVGFDGCVVTGSRASVYWDREWIDRVKAWVDDAINAGLPALGVCWGHQLLADVLGGQVEDMGEYEIGYRTVEQTTSNSLLTGIDEEFTVFTTHSDRVVEAPPDADIIAENDYGIHGFQTDRVFTVQFHPEYDMETAATVTKEKDDQLSESRIQEVLDGIHDENYAAACEAKQLFDNFIEFVRETDIEAQTQEQEQTQQSSGNGTQTAADD